MTTQEMDQDIHANGLDELTKVLEDLFAKKKDHYILFQLGESQALIKVQFSSKDPQLWYVSLRGLPAPQNVQTVLAQFLQEKAGVGKENFHDFHDVVRNAKIRGTEENLLLDYPSQDKEFKRNSLELAIKTNMWKKAEYAKTMPSASAHTLFAAKKSNLEPEKKAGTKTPRPKSQA